MMINEYNLLYNDLLNFDIPGYKSSWDDNGNKGSDKINFSQGALMENGFDTSFALTDKGFLKIRIAAKNANV